MLALLNLMIRPKSCSRHTTLFTTLLAATNLSCKATTPSQEISFSKYGDSSHMSARVSGRHGEAKPLLLAPSNSSL